MKKYPIEILSIIKNYNKIDPFVIELEVLFLFTKMFCLCEGGYHSRCALLALKHPTCVYTGVLDRIISFVSDQAKRRPKKPRMLH